MRKSECGRRFRAVGQAAEFGFVLREQRGAMAREQLAKKAGLIKAIGTATPEPLRAERPPKL